MVLPISFDTVTVTGRYIDLAGNPLTGAVTFTSTVTVVEPTVPVTIIPVPLTAILDGTGAFTIDLPATDDPDITPNGYTYKVEERFGGNYSRTYDIQVPYTTVGSIDLSTVAPVQPVTATVQLLPLSGGTMTGSLTLSGAPTTPNMAATKAYVDSMIGEGGGIVGPKGDKGDPGEPGPPGADGADGAPGVDGADGADGRDGVDGAPGVQGLPGADGAPGEQGPKGDKGDKGDPGERGLPGTDGAPGTTGATGDPGPKGDPGDPGVQGDPGPKGDKGDKGDPGEQGLPGTPGDTSAYGPADQNLIAWTHDPATLRSASNSSTSGTVYLCKVKVGASALVSNIIIGIEAAGTGLTAGQSFVGLYDSTGTRLGLSADQSGNWTTAGVKTIPLTAAQSVAAGFYYVALLAVGTTPPTFAMGAGGATNINIGLTTATARFLTGPTAQTALPASITIGSQTQNSGARWAALS